LLSTTPDTAVAAKRAVNAGEQIDGRVDPVGPTLIVTSLDCSKRVKDTELCLKGKSASTGVNPSAVAWYHLLVVASILC